MSIAQDGDLAASTAIPVLRSDRVVHRTRLLETLDGALTDPDHTTSVVLVCAPAGSGKTTFLADWAHRARADPGGPAVAWVTVDEEANAPHALHAEIVRALTASGHPHLRALGEELPNPTPAQPVPLATELADLDGPVRLVLDDAHLLHDPVALTDLELLLRVPPERLRVVVCGRFEPPLAFQKLRLDGRVLDVTSADLAFTAREAAIMLAEHDVELDPGALSSLMERTEGWAAGLRLAGMSLAGHPDPTALIDSFTGCRRAVADYLMEQVLAGQSEEIRQFLVKTSVPATFSAALAEELTGCADAHAIIDLLEHRNFLISRIETAPTEFRYHPLLRSYLRAEINRFGRRAVTDLEHATARWYARVGDALPSLEHGVAAGDAGDVESALSESGLALVLDGHGAAVERLLADAPHPIRDRPITQLVRAAAQLHAGNPTVAASLLGATGARAPDHETDFRTTLLAESLRLQLAVDTGEAGPALDRPAAADAGPTGDPHLDAFTALQLGRGQLQLGRLDAAEDHLVRARAHSGETDSAHLRSRTATTLGVVALCRGRLDDAQALAAAGRTQATETHASASVDDRDAVLLDALCHYLRNDTARAVELAGGPHGPTPTAEPERAAAVALFGLDEATDRRAAITALHTATTPGRATPHPPGLTAVVLPSILLAYVQVGETTWARELVTTASARLGRSGDVALIEAVLHLSTGQRERARTALRPVLDGELPCAATTNLVTAWLVEAELARCRGHDVRAHEAFAEALRRAEPARVLRPFHDLAATGQDLLAAGRGRFGAYDDFADRVWSSFPRTATAAAAQLTRRELELLAELPTWRTAEEIATDLCVSVNTVKTHLRGIYRKLGVTTRRDAVAAAHAHGLL